MKIAYGKLGRSVPLTMDEASSVGGDIEVIRLLHLLAEDFEIHIVGRNRGDELGGGIVNHWASGGIFHNCPVASRNVDAQYKLFIDHLDRGIERLPKFDAWVIWLGQHGSSLHPVPAVQKGMIGATTSPLISLVSYGYPLVHMVNKLHVKPVWLCPDPRNMVKFRDLWEPKQRDILAQFNTTKNNTFFSEEDNRLRTGSTRYTYSGIELLAVPHEGAPNLLEGRLPFGILVNEGPTNIPNRRIDILRRWAPSEDYEIFGDWTLHSQAMLNRSIFTVPVTEVRNTLSRWKSTLTMPASNSGWATSKPWECFSAGTICFKHPGYDTQAHIYDREHMGEELFSFLCPFGASDMKKRVEDLAADDALWKKFAHMQYDYLVKSRQRLGEGARAVKLAVHAAKE